MHGQHEGQRLLSTVAQTRFLDRYAGAEHLDAVEALRVEHGRLRNADPALAELDERERDPSARWTCSPTRYARSRSRRRGRARPRS